MTLPVYSQLAEGNVYDMEDKNPLWFATITNKRTKQMAYSDNNGQFKINAVFGDTIFVSHPGYVFTYKVITSSSGQWIYMERKKHHLEEVEVLSDMAKFQKDSAEKRVIYRKILLDAKQAPGVSLNNGVVAEGIFSSLALWISGKGKRNRKFVNTLIANENVSFVALRYNPRVVYEQTGLPEEEAMRFMLEYPMPYDYARSASDLEVKMWIRTNFREWAKKSGDTDTLKATQLIKD